MIKLLKRFFTKTKSEPEPETKQLTYGEESAVRRYMKKPLITLNDVDERKIKKNLFNQKKKL